MTHAFCLDCAAVVRFSIRLSDAMKHPSSFSKAATTGLGLESAPVKKSGSPDRAPNNAAIFLLHALATELHSNAEPTRSLNPYGIKPYHTITGSGAEGRLQECVQFLMPSK